MSLPVSIGLFLLACICEIGGGYLVWLSFREGRHWGYALAGAAVLILYGMIPILQPAHFGRVYAAYGGMFVVLSCSGVVRSMERDRIDSTPLERCSAWSEWWSSCMRTNLAGY